MKVIEQLCIKSYTVEDQQGTTFTVKQGETYTTSLPGHAMAAHEPDPEIDKVVVFSSYWVSVPADHFVEKEKGPRK